MEENLEQELEKRVILASIDFASSRGLNYSFEGVSRSRHRLIELGINTQTKESLFRHQIWVGSKEGDGMCESTSYVADSVEARQTYIDYLSHMNRANINLTNHVGDMWAKNPIRYPL